MSAHPDPAHERRRAEAAHWRARLAEEPAAALGDDYRAWSADPQNLRLFEEAQATWTAFDDFAAAPEMIALRQEALGDARRTERRRRAPPRRRLIAAGLAAAVLGVGALALLAPQLPRSYRTDVGERRVVMLADGSRLSLDAASQVRVRFTKGARQLDLVRGQARFDVAHDAARPFMVEAGHRTVIATGTAFNIDLTGREVVVTLIEGAVVVRPDKPAAAPARPVSLRAGQQLVAAGRAASPAVSTADVRGATAWERGQLIFTDEPLVEAVARVNRYAPRPIAVDPSAAGVRVSGAFDSADTAAFLDAMTSYFDLAADASPGGRVTLRVASS